MCVRLGVLERERDRERERERERERDGLQGFKEQDSEMIDKCSSGHRIVAIDNYDGDDVDDVDNNDDDDDQV